MVRPPARTRYWNAEALHGVSCLDAEYTDQYFAPHAHDALVIVVTDRGGSAYRSRGRSAEASASVLLVFNPSEPHSGHMRDSTYWRYRGLYLAQPALDRLLPRLGLTRAPGFSANAFADPDLIAAFRHTLRELDGGNAALACQSLLDACGQLFSRHGDARVPAPPPSTDRACVDVALATIRARFCEPITVDELASAAGLSVYQLIRQFNRLTGMPPHAHILRARLHAAIRYLRAGSTIAGAALASGFYDQSALTRHFRRAYGITPGQYAAAMRSAGGRNFDQDGW